MTCSNCGLRCTCQERLWMFWVKGIHYILSHSKQTWFLWYSLCFNYKYMKQWSNRHMFAYLYTFSWKNMKKRPQTATQNRKRFFPKATGSDGSASLRRLRWGGGEDPAKALATEQLLEAQGRDVWFLGKKEKRFGIFFFLGCLILDFVLVLFFFQKQNRERSLFLLGGALCKGALPLRLVGHPHGDRHETHLRHQCGGGELHLRVRGRWFWVFFFFVCLFFFFFFWRFSWVCLFACVFCQLRDLVQLSLVPSLRCPKHLKVCCWAASFNQAVIEAVEMLILPRLFMSWIEASEEEVNVVQKTLDVGPRSLKSSPNIIGFFKNSLAMPQSLGLFSYKAPGFAQTFACQVNMAWLEPKAKQLPSGTKLDKERPVGLVMAGVDRPPWCWASFSENLEVFEKRWGNFQRKTPCSSFFWTWDWNRQVSTAKLAQIERPECSKPGCLVCSLLRRDSFRIDY